MKLLFISEYFPPQIMGGGEINLFLLTKALVKKKIDVHVLTSYHKGSKRFEIMEGVKVHRRLKTGETPNSFIGNFTRSFSLPQSIVKEAIKLSNKIEFDTIHFIGVSIIAAPKLRKLNIPLVSTIESYVTLCPKGDRIYYGRNVEGMCSFIDFFMAQRKSSEIGKMKNKWYLKYNPLFLTYVYRRYRKLNNSLKSTRLIAISKHMQTLLQKHRLQMLWTLVHLKKKKENPGN